MAHPKGQPTARGRTGRGQRPGPRRPRQPAITAASLLGAAVVALLGWTLWTLSSGSALESAPDPAQRSSPSALAEPSTELPVAPDPSTSGGSEARPRALDAEPPAPQGREGLLVAVTDEASGKPVPIFQVYALEAAPGDPLERLAQALSHPFHERTGVFFLKRPPGRWDVVVMATGYEPGVLADMPSPGLKRTPVPLALSRGPGISGLVLDNTLSPVVGVKAFLHVTELFGPEGKMPKVRTATSGADGRFNFSPLGPGDYAVSLHELNNTEDRQGGLRVSGNTVQIELYLTPRHELTIRVETETGDPVQGALVEARSQTAHFARGLTNENGLLLLEHLPDGTYTVSASHRQHGSAKDVVQLLGGSTQEVRWLKLPDRQP